MRVTLTPLELHDPTLSLHRVPSSACVGFVRVTREPGGRLRDWHRTAILFRDEGVSDLVRQLHQVRLEAWTPDGILLTGIEREWRRKSCTETPQAWLLSFREVSRASVYLLRLDGARRDRSEVRSSTPMRGRVSVDDGEQLKPRRALLTASDGALLAQLDRVQLQRWDARGLVLAGNEASGYGRRLIETWQSWFVTFPGAATELPPHRRVLRPEFVV